MAFGGFRREGAAQPMADINVTPLVDVMLVLLVIFIITAPLLGAAVKLQLPREAAPAAEARTDSVVLSIDADGALWWGDERIDDAAFERRLAAAAQRDPPPDLQLRADQATRYARVAFVMAAAQRAGLTRLGFVTEPPPAGAAR